MDWICRVCNKPHQTLEALELCMLRHWNEEEASINMGWSKEEVIKMMKDCIAKVDLYGNLAQDFSSSLEASAKFRDAIADWNYLLEYNKAHKLGIEESDVRKVK